MGQRMVRDESITGGIRLVNEPDDAAGEGWARLLDAVRSDASAADLAEIVYAELERQGHDLRGACIEDPDGQHFPGCGCDA